MSLKEQLLQDMKAALKSKDTLRKDVIQVVRAGVLQVEKDEKVILEDEGVITVIGKEVKKRLEVLPDYERAGREDKILEIKTQISILREYLPEQLSEEQVREAVASVIKDLGATSMKDMGNVMKEASAKLKGKTEGKLINQIVKELLS
ncbi:MAG: GatB/YqeY domain-containing protein [Lachnospirales bacterium]